MKRAVARRGEFNREQRMNRPGAKDAKTEPRGWKKSGFVMEWRGRHEKKRDTIHKYFV
jgi:hypothetical protein